MNERRFAQIDGLRALAVLAVLFCHVCDFVPGPLKRAIGNSGAHGVDLFFAISGFCLAYPMLRAHRDRGTAIARVVPFLRRRLVRVAPAYYVALLLFGTLALSKFGLPTSPYPRPPLGAQLLAIVQDLCFLTNQQPIHNCDFWSLGVEMRWYVLFPLVMALYVRSRVGFAVLMLAFYAVYASPWGIPDEGMYPCFMAGIVAADVALRKPHWQKYAVPFAAVSIVLAIWNQATMVLIDHGSALWHVAAFSTIVAVNGSDVLGRVFSDRAVVTIGIASYSIYLMHHPILNELALRGVPVGIAGVAALALGLLFWYVVERQLAAPAARRALESALTFRGLAVREPVAVTTP